MIATKPIRIDKSFNFSDIETGEENEIPYIKVRGYASKMLDASGKFVIDGDLENIDTMGIDLSRMQSGTIPLLYGHDQKSAVGTISTAEYKQDGLFIEAILYKLDGDALTNYVYEAVKAGILSSFSVGILVKEFDVISRDGEDYLQLAKSELIETSIVSVPSNPQATFNVIEMKSIGDAGEELKSYATVISKSVVKAENPNACEEFTQCVTNYKKKEVEMVDKGLTYEETANEPWARSEDFFKALNTLKYTIEDNWYSEKYWDEVSPEEALINVQGTFESFIKEFERLLVDGNENSEKGIKEKTEMALKNVEDEATPKEEVVTTPEEEVVVENTPDKTKEEIPEEKTEVIETNPKTEPEPIKVEDEATQAPAEVKRTLDDLIADVGILKVDELEYDDLDKVYSALSEATEKIEALVVDQLKEELQKTEEA